ncbi:MAG: metal-dependent hydrolase [Desulfocapsaceae bacterium]|nr:metal-dependent hydrolase [Desulfocapsaceae bacterium]
MKRIVSRLGIIIALVLLVSTTAYAEFGSMMQPYSVSDQTDKVTVTFLGQSAFKLTSGTKTIFIDPWITGNPVCPITLEDITEADLILVTHDHFDHLGDAVAISKATGAKIVAVYETAMKLVADGLSPDHILFDGNGRDIGGPIDIDGLTLIMTPAVHSSASGVPVGYIIKFADGPTIYHAGDTAIFSDMQLWGQLYPIDLALLPIGGGFTMDAMQAAQSLRLLKPTKVIPMHYGTFPMLAPNADEFVGLAKKIAPRVRVTVLEPGESMPY